MSQLSRVYLDGIPLDFVATLLLIDHANPSAAGGWRNREQESLVERSIADYLLTLALIHHISISNNVPLKKSAEYFASLAEWLVIEFVPKSDKKVQQLLASREDIFDNYTRARFEETYLEIYELVLLREIRGSGRVLYLFRRKRRDPLS